MKKKRDFKDGDVRLQFGYAHIPEEGSERGFEGYLLTLDCINGEKWFEATFAFTEKEYGELTPEKLVSKIDEMLVTVMKKYRENSKT